ncbi:MAG: hypothetical protein SVY53_03195 [Chloroflexota bacterium]|nr:hypothetical protein [Chloroflexota bacterium]
MSVDNIACLARVDYDEKASAILEVHKEHPYETVIKVKKGPDITKTEGYGVIDIVSKEGQIVKKRGEMDDARAEGWDALLVRPIKLGKMRQYYLARFNTNDTRRDKPHNKGAEAPSSTRPAS